MAFKLDTIEGSAEFTGQGFRISRGFTADELNTAVEPYELILQLMGMSGFPGIGSEYPSASYSDALAQNIIIQGTSADSARGNIVYTTSEMGFTPSAYVLTRSTRLVQNTESILPNGVLIQASQASYGVNLSNRPVMMSFARPCSSYVAEGIRFGEPNYPGADYVGYVNNSSFHSRPKGHLRIEAFETQWSVYQGYHKFRCELLGNILGRDWSSFGILYNSLLGKYVDVDPATVAAAIGDAYDYGIIGATNNGFVHVGGFPLVNFSDIGL